MISPSYQWLVLVAHILGVTVWVGGQITLASLVKTLRHNSEGILPLIARRFALTAWPAFGVMVVSGILLLIDIDPAEQGTAYAATLAVKLALVFVAATAVLAHSMSNRRIIIAIGGAVGLLASLAALALGVLLAA